MGLMGPHDDDDYPDDDEPIGLGFADYRDERREKWNQAKRHVEEGTYPKDGDDDVVKFMERLNGE